MFSFGSQSMFFILSSVLTSFTSCTSFTVICLSSYRSFGLASALLLLLTGHTFHVPTVTLLFPAILKDKPKQLQQNAFTFASKLKTNQRGRSSKHRAWGKVWGCCAGVPLWLAIRAHNNFSRCCLECSETRR